MIAGHSLATWAVFHLIVFGLLALDLGLLSRNPHVIRLKEALLWSLFWICLGLGYGLYIFWHDGNRAGTEYVTGYLVEKSLSVDNLFVFAVIFAELGIERRYQHRLLFWGILGAIVLRGLMIAAGTQLLERFHWLIYIFGAFLVLTGIKFFFQGDEKINPHKNPVLRLARRFLPFTDEPSGGHFIKRINGRLCFTTFFAALILVEASDVIFALDSVPAVMGITRDPYLIYTSNIFAILGLRSLFFVLEDLLARFHMLKIGLAFVLIFVGGKMLAESFYHFTPWVSLLIVLGILSLSVALSLIFPLRKKAKT